MSKELLPCPFCGETPDTSLIDDVTHYACQTHDCICEDMWATLEEWNRRFICLDRNGKKVFPGDSVAGQTTGGWQSGKIEYSKQYWCYGIRSRDGEFHRIFGDIELIAAALAAERKEE